MITILPVHWQLTVLKVVGCVIVGGKWRDKMDFQKSYQEYIKELGQKIKTYKIRDASIDNVHIDGFNGHDIDISVMIYYDVDYIKRILWMS